MIIAAKAMSNFNACFFSYNFNSFPISEYDDISANFKRQP